MVLEVSPVYILCRMFLVSTPSSICVSSHLVQIAEYIMFSLPQLSPHGFDPNGHCPLLQSIVLKGFEVDSPDIIGTSLSCLARAELLVIGTLMVAVAPSSLNHVDFDALMSFCLSVFIYRCFYLLLCSS